MTTLIQLTTPWSVSREGARKRVSVPRFSMTTGSDRSSV